jgi:hypothetical protein
MKLSRQVMPLKETESHNFNPVALTIQKLTFELLRWIQNLHQSHLDPYILHANSS